MTEPDPNPDPLLDDPADRAPKVPESASAKPRRTRRRRRILTATILIVAVITAFAVVRAVRQPAAATDPTTQYPRGQIIPAAQRTLAPHLAGPTIEGQRLDLAAWAGHVVVVNIWGSWCVPCREEAPDLKRVSAETGYLGVRFVGIDIRDDPASGRAFETSFGIAYPSFDDSQGALVPLFGRYTTPAVPTTYVIDAHGRLAAMFLGKITYNGLETDLVDIAHEKN